MRLENLIFCFFVHWILGFHGWGWKDSPQLQKEHHIFIHFLVACNMFETFLGDGWSKLWWRCLHLTEVEKWWFPSLTSNLGCVSGESLLSTILNHHLSPPIWREYLWNFCQEFEANPRCLISPGFVFCLLHFVSQPKISQIAELFSDIFGMAWTRQEYVFVQQSLGSSFSWEFVGYTFNDA